MDRHADVVELWWDELVPEREEDSERWNSSGWEEKGTRSCTLIRTPNTLLSLEGTALGSEPILSSNDLRPCRIVDMDFWECTYFWALR